jgi:hypothetical protein
MIQEIDPRLMMIIGLLFMLLGFALPVSMIMQLLKSTFFLNFLSYIASFLGLMLGIIGVAMLATRPKRE